jgi:hypothetical protein
MAMPPQRYLQSSKSTGEKAVTYFKFNAKQQILGCRETEPWTIARKGHY